MLCTANPPKCLYFYICVKVLALPIPIVVDNFAAYYDEQKLQAALVDSRLSSFENIFFLHNFIGFLKRLLFTIFRFFDHRSTKKRSQ